MDSQRVKIGVITVDVAGGQVSLQVGNARVMLDASQVRELVDALNGLAPPIEPAAEPAEAATVTRSRRVLRS